MKPTGKGDSDEVFIEDGLEAQLYACF